MHHHLNIATHTSHSILIRFFTRLLLTLLLAAGLSSCNKDDVIENAAGLKPVIALDSEYGVYTVKIGHELTIAPEFSNIGDATITWTIDGRVVCYGTEWTAVWNEQGEFYVTITAENPAGTAVEELRVDVLDLTPPVISLRLPDDGLKVAANTDYEFTPDIQHADTEDFRIDWYVNDIHAGDGLSYTFNESTPGIYHVRIVAENSDGAATKEFDVEVVESLPCSAMFLPSSYFQTSTTRFTFAGRPVFLQPVVENIDNPEYEWSVDGTDAGCHDRMFEFTPDRAGEYSVEVNITTGEDAAMIPVTRNVSRAVSTCVTAQVKVVCVEASEQNRLRPRTGSSSPYSTRVFEWTPAPGQFIGENGPGWMMGNESTLEAANAWAESRLAGEKLVSLGAFGGYIIVGFDHSIVASGAEYDFAVAGNAFLNAQGGSNEPGIVWVMQDVNGNGLPDDEWYELKGSESGKSTTLQNYYVTYFRPEAPRMDVEWIDSEGNTGTVKYLPLLHKQDYYYPAWISASSYTLYGTRISAKNSADPTTGFWNNAPYEWGYADNVGSDALDKSAPGDSQRTGFRISNAMYADGTPANLAFIDFVKVQVAVQATSGALGEISTEVCRFQDLSIAE